MQIKLISYGDFRYETQREFFRETAVSSSFFDDVTIFSNEDMTSEFLTEFYDILNHTDRGSFAWKPYFVKRTLDEIEENDILVYCDAGCMINSWGKERFNQYIEKLIASETGILAFEINHKEYEYTKKEVFEYFNSTEVVTHSKQVIGTIFLVRKCTHSVSLVNRWYHVLQDNPKLFTDELNQELQDPGFINHRHDQSIWSIILKTYGADILSDETHFKDLIRDGHSFPLWAARLGRFDPFYIAVSGAHSVYEIKVVTDP
ncbi:hypothetical protein SAMN05421820_103359 [Pedobacter steynii]|uniref:Uncharacterized protein n=1 Tax=Pedobacter steynii TaxID=430522 RepID=A0A1G9RU25_9SPHI|nr:hypothetical protein [Pedobacter steynii]NQX37646.1 hypothetical protein [Pedobacter steynii]SDM26736.1 hypothetical protein SAMN05421820_103359 [Pedobacter steynii]